MTLPLNLSLFSGVLTSQTVSGDLNDITKSGFYFVKNPTNGPTTNWGHLIVNYNDLTGYDYREVQLFVTDTSSGDGHGIWSRFKTSTAEWSPWEHYATTDYVTNEITSLLTTVEF